MLRRFVFLAVSAAALIALTGLTLRILCQDSNATSGILTLKLNLTAFLDETLLLLPTPKRSIVEDLQQGAGDIFNEVATRIPSAASKVQGALGSAATLLLEETEQHVPQNCSLGTERFCVGYKYEPDLQCSSFPLKLSSLMPEAIQNLPDPIRDKLYSEVDKLAPLAKSSDKIASLQVEAVLVCGLLLIAAMAICSVWLAFERRSCLATTVQKLPMWLRTLVFFVLSFAGCVPFIILASITRVVVTTADAAPLPSWIETEKGEVYRLGIGALSCALVLAALAAGGPLFDAI